MGTPGIPLPFERKREVVDEDRNATDPIGVLTTGADWVFILFALLS